MKNSFSRAYVTRNPPLKSGEKFLGNVFGNKLPEHLEHITGIRLAQPAYDIYGKEIVGYWAMIANPEAAEEFDSVMNGLSALRGA